MEPLTILAATLRIRWSISISLLPLMSLTRCRQIYHCTDVLVEAVFKIEACEQPLNCQLQHSWPA